MSDVNDGAKVIPLRDWIPQITQQIVSGFNPVKVILFGSVARGEDGPDSDVDLMVIFERVEPGTRRELMARLMRAITVPVPFDVFVTDVAEYEAKKNINGTIFYWPAREGVVVHDRAVA